MTSGLAQNTITGRVTDGKNPLNNVHVTNLTAETNTATDQEGRYAIVASPKEELQFTYIGMDTTTIIVEDITRILNIAMNPRIEILDEVVVTKKINKQKNLAMNYTRDSSIVNTSFGYISPSTVAYHLKVIDGSEFSPGSDVLMAIAGRRSGIRVGTYGNSYTGQSVRTLFLRGGSSISNKRPAIFEVDGNIFTDPPIWLDVSNIQRVGIIPGVQAVWRYGNIASGGVVIINTFNGVHGLREENSLQYYDQAKLRNNFVTGKVLSNTDMEDNSPLYVKELSTTSSLDEALVVYEKFEEQFSNIPYFYLDAYVLFFDKYGAMLADKIIEDNFEVFAKNAVWLKALAFTYESQARFKEAQEIYKKVYALRPDYAQSYIDLANSYRNVEMPESANALLARHSYLLDEGFLVSDSLHFGEMMQREIDNLILANENRAASNGTRSVQDDYSTRLVFEWNDSEAEFDLQFVNPNNQYFNWKHSLQEMPDRIRAEKQLGFSMADFLLDDELQGIWKVNTTYLGNKQLTPTYLKATIYKNYGSKFQTKKVKVFRLGIKGANQQLFSFPITSSIVQSK